jgi:ABC-type sugar transport system substrate-binding protein
MKKAFLTAVLAASVALPASAFAQDEPIRIGILVALEGAFAEGGADGVRNVEMALEEAGFMAGGREIEYVVAPSDTTPDTAVRQARKLNSTTRPFGRTSFGKPTSPTSRSPAGDGSNFTSIWMWWPGTCLL